MAFRALLPIWMPDSPAVSLAQLSVLPAPSEVTTPRPVTTTIGRPILSLVDGISCSPSDLDAGLAGREFGPVVGLAGAERGDNAETGHHHNRPAHFVFGRWHFVLSFRSGCRTRRP